MESTFKLYSTIEPAFLLSKANAFVEQKLKKINKYKFDVPKEICTSPCSKFMLFNVLLNNKHQIPVHLTVKYTKKTPVNNLNSTRMSLN